MRVAKLKGEKNLSELVERLFEIKGDAEKRERAEAGILSANPHLNAFENVPDGVPFVVPDLEGIKGSTEEHTLFQMFAELSGQVQNALTSVRARLNESEESNIKETRATLRQLKTKKVGSLLGDAPEIKKKAGEVKTELEMRLKDSEALKQFHVSALDQIAADLINLGEFANRFGSRAVAGQRLSAVKPPVAAEPAPAAQATKSSSKKEKSAPEKK
jgi:hypothetical protein